MQCACQSEGTQWHPALWPQRLAEPRTKDGRGAGEGAPSPLCHRHPHSSHLCFLACGCSSLLGLNKLNDEQSRETSIPEPGLCRKLQEA